jgi:NADP-dependent 3-hydroxy acid dehydrogenase YdfG
MKRVLIFGATSGIGRAVANYCAEQGWQVVALGRRKANLRELERSNKRIKGIRCDVTKRRSVSSAMATAKRGGKIDAVLLFAGAGFEPGKPIEKASKKSWNDAINTNVHGAFSVVLATKSHFKKQNSGIFIAIGSRAAINGDVLGGRVAYSASKHGQSAIAETLRREMVDDMINGHAFIINPGAVPGTEMVAKQKLADDIGTPLNRATELIFTVLSQPDRFKDHFSLMLEDGDLHAVKVTTKKLNVG